jgi:hypothetical protein
LDDLHAVTCEVDMNVSHADPRVLISYQSDGKGRVLIADKAVSA